MPFGLRKPDAKIQCAPDFASTSQIAALPSSLSMPSTRRGSR
jgi:hypothetical protein